MQRCIANAFPLTNKSQRLLYANSQSYHRHTTPKTSLPDPRLRPHRDYVVQTLSYTATPTCRRDVCGCGVRHADTFVARRFVLFASVCEVCVCGWMVGARYTSLPVVGRLMRGDVHGWVVPRDVFELLAHVLAALVVSSGVLGT